jgi:ribosomal protein S18 acetylase RimI-like enzyme
VTIGMDHASIQALERLADNAWPAAVREALGGWILNAADGFSGRLNACWPLGATPEGLTLADAADQVELWYQRRGLPPLFKLLDQDGALADILRNRGYQSRTPTLVMTGPALQGVAPGRVIVSQKADAAFEAVFLGVQGDPADAAERMSAFRRIPEPRFFARIEEAGQPVAIGAACAHGGQVGLFGMRTLPSHRRQGMAADIVLALLAAGADAGASGAYLQVEAGNDAAIALYRGFGFDRAYRYLYWARA